MYGHRGQQMTFQPAPDMARLMCVHAVPFCDAPADEGAGASRSPLLSGALRDRVLHVAGTLAGIPSPAPAPAGGTHPWRPGPPAWPSGVAWH